MELYLDVFKTAPVADKRRKLIDEPVNEDLIKKNKYANNSSYVPEAVYKRILNTITNYQWSFVPHSWEDKGDFIQYVGMLVVPGFGVHTGVGSAKVNKKDSSNALSAAKTYAFKNACKEMGLAPNVDDKDDIYEEDLFEYDVDIEEEEEEFDLTEEEEAPKKKGKTEKAPEKKSKKEDEKSSSSKKMTVKDRIKEVREAYELEDDDEFVAFIQIWDEDILEIDDMDDEDWIEFLEYLESNKGKFEEF